MTWNRMVVLLLIFFQPVSVQGVDETFQYAEALRISQSAIGSTVSATHMLRNRHGEFVNLGNFRGKPLVISMIYTSCYHICPMTTRHLNDVVIKARDALGDESFNVITIGFNTQFDTPDTMAAFARQQSVDDAHWQFLSIDSKTLEKLAEELGFVYFQSSRGFDHLIQATVLDASGVIYRQVYGEVFDVPLLIGPLRELILGRPQPNDTVMDDLVRRIRFFCTLYDPARDAYRFDYSLFIGMAIGASILVITAVILFLELRKMRKNKEQ